MPERAQKSPFTRKALEFLPSLINMTVLERNDIIELINLLGYYEPSKKSLKLETSVAASLEDTSFAPLNSLPKKTRKRPGRYWVPETRMRHADGTLYTRCGYWAGSGPVTLKVKAQRRKARRKSRKLLSQEITSPIRHSSMRGQKSNHYTLKQRKRFSRRLKTILKSKNLTISALARSLKLSRSAVGLWYVGQITPSPSNLDALCRVLNVIPSELGL